MKNITKSLSALISSIIVLVVGILCIVAGASSGETSANAYEGISLTLGISLIVASGLVLLLTLIAVIMSKGKTTFGPVAIGVSLTLALGIFFVSDKGLGGNLIWLFLNFVPFVLIVVGSIIIVDAIINIIIGVTRKELPQALIPSIVSIVLGAVSVLFGALMVGNDPVISKGAQLVIFGIIIVIYALAICAIASFALYANRFANKEPKKDSIDAEVNEVKTEE
jgi:hypothetical protein